MSESCAIDVKGYKRSKVTRGQSLQEVKGYRIT